MFLPTNLSNLKCPAFFRNYLGYFSCRLLLRIVVMINLWKFWVSWLKASYFNQKNIVNGLYTYDVHENRPIFMTPHPPRPATSKILPPSWTFTSNFKRIPPVPSPNDNQSVKENIIQGWLLYVIRSLLQVGFRFQYQLINLVWLSIDLFSFSWSQSCPGQF